MNTKKLTSLLSSILAIAVLAALAYYANKPRQDASSQSGQYEQQGRRTKLHQGQTTNAQQSDETSVGFASQQKLDQHFQKHGAEFGDISLEEYLRTAQKLRDTPVGGNILEYIRPDGIASRYERSTGTFIAFNSDKTIRTCFKPNDGESYFHRQKNRPH